MYNINIHVDIGNSYDKIDYVYSMCMYIQRVHAAGLDFLFHVTCSSIHIIYIYIIMNHNFNVSISMFCIFEGAAFFLENHGKSIFPGFQCSTAFFSQPS